MKDRTGIFSKIKTANGTPVYHLLQIKLRKHNQNIYEIIMNLNIITIMDHRVNVIQLRELLTSTF